MPAGFLYITTLEKGSNRRAYAKNNRYSSKEEKVKTTLNRWLATLGLAFAVSTAASALPQYRLTDVSIPNYSYSSSYGLNNNGQVLIYTNGRGYIWKDYKQTQVGTLGGYTALMDINDSGIAVGTSSNSSNQNRAFMWDGTNLVDLGSLSVSSSCAWGINEKGQIVGYVGSYVSEYKAFLWEDGEMIALSTLGGKWNQAFGINNNGVVVGCTEDNYGKYYACLWENNQVKAIGGDLGAQAFAVNDKKQVVGCSGGKGFLWQNNTFTYLSNLGYGGSANDINEDGLIVGWAASQPTGQTHAVIWDNEKMADLNNYINAPGWTLSLAYAINDRGQIAGVGLYNGQQRAFLLTPVPEPSSIFALLAGLGSIGGVALKKRK